MEGEWHGYRQREANAFFLFGIYWVNLLHLQALYQMFVVNACKKMLSELLEFLGCTCTYPEYGGCLKAEKGP